MALPPLGNSDHVAVSVSTDFSSNSNVHAPVIYTNCNYSRVDWHGLRYHQEMFRGWISFNSLLLLLLSKCIFLIVNIKPSLTHLRGFELLVLVLFVHRNHVFHLPQQSKYTVTKTNK